MRLLLKIVLFLILAAVLVAGFFLVPPHLQIRGVEPTIPQEEDLLALMKVPNGPVSVRYINTSDQVTPDGTLAHSVFVIEWANGNRFMIDAGMDRAAAIEFGDFLESAVGAQPTRVHGIVSEMLGEGVKRVSGIAFTHLHSDHAQGVINFCEARGDGVTAYQTESQNELQNFNTEEGARIIGASCLNQKVLSGEGVLTADEFPGLGIIPVGGHTPGSTLFAIAAPEQLWLLSGDTTNTKANINTNTGKGFVYSYVFVPEHTGRTEALRNWLKDVAQNSEITVVVSHDLRDIKNSGIAEYDE